MFIIHFKHLQRMFHRRKIILNLVDEFGKKIEKGRFYQLLFLACRMQKAPEFHFVPIGDSLISFLAETDVRGMKKYGYLAESDDVVLKSMPKEAALHDDVKAVLRSLRKESGKFPAKVLNDYIMKVFPPEFNAAAKDGIRATLNWLDGPISVTELVTEELLPLADQGLRLRGVDDDDRVRYLECLRRRVQLRRTLSEWFRCAYRSCGGKTPRETCRTVVQRIMANQASGQPVPNWPEWEAD